MGEKSRLFSGEYMLFKFRGLNGVPYGFILNSLNGEIILLNSF
jgi:hypothetical protein